MREKRRKFTPEFKSEAVRLVVDTSRPIAEIAREIGVHEGTLGNWVNQHRGPYSQGSGRNCGRGLILRNKAVSRRGIDLVESACHA